MLCSQAPTRSHQLRVVQGADESEEFSRKADDDIGDLNAGFVVGNR